MMKKIVRRKALKYMGTLATVAGIGTIEMSALAKTVQQSENAIMSKKILVFSASSRRNGNSSTLSDEFIRGAMEVGHECEKIYLSDKTINGCTGCGYCRSTDRNCVQHDSMSELYEKLLAANVIVLASPVYYYTFNAQMKTVMDRTFAIENNFSGKTVYLIGAGAAPSEEYMTTMIDCFRKYIHCFGDMNEGGIVFACGAVDVGDVIENKPAMQKAYQMGKDV